MQKFKITSSDQTQKIAKLLAQEIIKKRIFSHALIVTLKGDLGAGKTTFAQGFLRGLGVKSKITSPTFVLVKSYKVKSYKVYHIDAYRIKDSKEILDLNWKEIISDQKNIILVEWPERIVKILPKNKIQINFKYGKKENERGLIFS